MSRRSTLILTLTLLILTLPIAAAGMPGTAEKAPENTTPAWLQTLCGQPCATWGGAWLRWWDVGEPEGEQPNRAAGPPPGRVSAAVTCENPEETGCEAYPDPDPNG